MVKLLFNEFSPQSSKFFEKCERLEKECSIYKMDINKKENRQMCEREQNMNEIISCTYCGIKDKRKSDMQVKSSNERAREVNDFLMSVVN